MPDTTHTTGDKIILGGELVATDVITASGITSSAADQSMG